MGTWERQDNGSNQWTPLTSAPVSKWAPSAAGEHGGTPNRHLVGMVVTNSAPLLVAFLAPAPPTLPNHCVSRISQMFSNESDMSTSCSSRVVDLSWHPAGLSP